MKQIIQGVQTLIRALVRYHSLRMFLGVLGTLFLPVRNAFRRAFSMPQIAIAANATLAGTHPSGGVTLIAGAAIAARHLLLKLSSGAWVVAGAADKPIAVSDDDVDSGEFLNGNILGNTPGTLLLTAGGNVTVGAEVYVAADGKVTVIPTAAGTYYCVGVALTAGASGDLIEVAHRAPVAATVSGS